MHYSSNSLPASTKTNEITSNTGRNQGGFKGKNIQQKSINNHNEIRKLSK